VKDLTEKQQRPPIKVKMKIGEIEFEIESQEDQIQNTVDKILQTVTDRLKNTNLSQVIERQATQPRAETCKGVIQKLWEETWFSEPKGLDDVHTELARRGFHYDRTAVAHALVDLVKDNILTRIGKPRRYQYAQKRPPT
jgi:predicted transcriptional regulator